MTDDRTIAEILADFDAALLALQTTEADAQDAIDAIDARLATRRLTAAEIEQRARLRAAQSAAQDAMTELAAATVTALDRSQEVDRLRNAFVLIVAGLKRAKKRVEKIAKVAKATAKAIEALEKVVPKLAKLAI